MTPTELYNTCIGAVNAAQRLETATSLASTSLMVLRKEIVEHGEPAGITSLVMGDMHRLLDRYEGANEPMRELAEALKEMES